MNMMLEYTKEELERMKETVPLEERILDRHPTLKKIIIQIFD